MAELKKMYSKLDLGPSNIDPTRALPQSILADPDDRSLSRLEITDRVFADERGFHPLYQGKWDRCDVIVKFCERYGDDVHRFLVRQDPPLAPKLHFCAPLLGGSMIVVMTTSMLGSLSTNFGKDGSVPESVKADLQRAAGLLSAKGSVHGDLRRPNVLITKRGPSGQKRKTSSSGDSEETRDPSLSGPRNVDEAQAMLIDFDWSGEDKEVFYSCTLNRESDIQWPKDAFPGGFISVSHDQYVESFLEPRFMLRG